MALLQKFRCKCRPFSHSHPVDRHVFLPILRFSASSSDPNGDDLLGEGGSPAGVASDSPPSPFADIKSRLRQPLPVRRPASPSSSNGDFSSSFVSQQPSKIASLEEIRGNLSEFRRRSAPPPPCDSAAGDAPTPPALSFEDLYKSNVTKKADEDRQATPSTFSFESIRESLRQLRNSDQARAQSRPPSDLPFSLRNSRDPLRMQPGEGPLMRGRTTPETLPQSIFGRELGEKAKESESRKSELIRMYSYGELGEKLSQLRPEVKTKKKNWFSLEELNERLVKLREMEEKDLQSRSGGLSFIDIRDSLLHLKKSSDAGALKTSMQSLALIGRLGGQVTPYMLSPPKDDLVEKYFHPDNMSSKEKLKLELEKVREEFKMSESDCGSSRVQVALLTTKIKHLSSVLHKKDKHSRKGLQEMVQRRKKLLKYLRRMDWDSYCFVLSKLGLRDNPDLKTYKMVLVFEIFKSGLGKRNNIAQLGRRLER